MAKTLEELRTAAKAQAAQTENAQKDYDIAEGLIKGDKFCIEGADISGLHRSKSGRTVTLGGTSGFVEIPNYQRKIFAKDYPDLEFYGEKAMYVGAKFSLNISLTLPPAKK